MKKMFENVSALLLGELVMYYVDPITHTKYYGYQQRLPAPPYPAYTFWTDDRNLAGTFKSATEAIKKMETFPPHTPYTAPLSFERL